MHRALQSKTSCLAPQLVSKRSRLIERDVYEPMKMKHLSRSLISIFFNSLLSCEIFMTSLSPTPVHLPFRSSVVRTQLTGIVASQNKFVPALCRAIMPRSMSHVPPCSLVSVPRLSKGPPHENRPLGIMLQGSGVCNCWGYLGSV